jgi:Thioredoxin
MPEFPPPIRLPGEPPLPDEPHELHHRHDAPAVVDEDLDLFGVEDVVARLAERIEQVPSDAVHPAEDGSALLAPPFAATRDRVDGPPLPRASLVVFGAHGTPWSRPLGSLLAHVRQRHPTTVAVAWRHFPDPVAHPRATVLALAAEAAAAVGRFWPLTREMLGMRHDDPADLHAAMLRAGVDPARAAEAMRAGIGADRIVDDVASALASGVTYGPALFLNGERYRGDIDPTAISAALEDSSARSGR